MDQLELLNNETVEVFHGKYLSPDVELLNQLVELIEQHFKKQRDPKFFAEALEISVGRLNRLCKNYLHSTIYELLQNRIHKEAELLLTHTRLTAKQISYELSVSGPQYFSRCFKRVSGVSPLAYRNKNKVNSLIWNNGVQKDLTA